MRNGWRLQKLSEIGDCSIGLTYKPEEVCNQEGTLVLRSSNIQNAKVVYGDDVYVMSKVSTSATVKKGDILICVRNGSRSLIGKCALIGAQDAGHAFGAFMAIFRSPINRFVYQLFQTDEYRRQINRNLGSTINQITNKNIRDLQFRFPSRAEQDRIVNILSTWDDSISAVKELIARKKLYLKSVLSSCVGDARVIPQGEGWAKTTIGDVATLVQQRVDWDDHANYRLVTVKRGSGGMVFRGDRRGHDILTKDMYQLRSGDFLISKRQVVHGAWAIVPPEFDGAHVSKEYACLRAKRGKLWMPYLDWLSKTKRLQHEAFICSYGVDIEKMVLNTEWLLQTPLLLPSIESQKRISAYLDCLQREITVLETYATALQNQKRGIAQRLLNERLSVDPNAEKKQPHVNEVAL